MVSRNIHPKLINEKTEIGSYREYKYLLEQHSLNEKQNSAHVSLIKQGKIL